MSGLEGELVRLRAPEPDDAARIWEVLNDDVTRRTSLHAAAPMSLAEVQASRDRDRFASFVIEGRADRATAGFLDLVAYRPIERSARLGMALHVDHRGRGLGTEALRLALGFAFERAHLHRVHLGVVEDNVVARQVYERVGFVEEGRLRDDVWRDGRWHDLVVMSVLAHEWPA